MQGTSIYFQDLINSVKELNPDVTVDASGKDIYVGELEPNQRTGIHYKGKHICNIDKDFIPEFNVNGGRQKNLVPVHPNFALANPDVAITQQILIDPDNIVMLAQLNEALGTAKAGQVSFGGYEVIATREKVMDDKGEVDDAILLRRYLVWKESACHVNRIGWRWIAERLINSNIPGITRDSLGKALNTSLINNEWDVTGFEKAEARA